MENFEWDDDKAELNAIKHGISFESAACAFDDPYYCILEDRKHSDQERRHWLIGDSGFGIVVVVFTIRQPERAVRIISARFATQRERRIYEQNKRV